MRKPSNLKDGKHNDPSPRGKRKLVYHDQKKQPKLPLTGKSIYLDVKDARLARKLETDLKRLGSSVEKFFIKEINYLITSQPRPKHKNEDKLHSADSPAAVSTPSPFNCGPSPSPGAVETKAPQSVTRGKAILQKAQLNKKQHTSSIIENAEKWQVKIVSVEAALKWIQKELAKLPQNSDKSKKNQPEKPKGSRIKRLRSPMLKFESLTQQYRPVYGHLVSWPYANVETPKGTCPFDGSTVGRGERSREERGDRIGLVQLDNNFPASPAEMDRDQSASASNQTPKEDVQGKSRPSENQANILGGVKVLTAGEIRRRKEQKKTQERKRGYCECCQVKYEDLDKHVREDQHKSYIRDKKNYETLDQLISSGPSTAHFLQRILLDHCTTKRNMAASQSDSEDEVLLVTPGKASKKTTGKDKTASSVQSPGKGKSPAVVGKGKSRKELRMETCDGKKMEEGAEKTVMKQQVSVVSRQQCKNDSKQLKESDKNSKEIRKDLHKEDDTQKTKEDQYNKEENPMIIQTRTRGVLNVEVKGVEKDKLEVDNLAKSPEKKSCTSDSLDLKNHVVPVRKRNYLGVYPDMSPSRVSWGRHQSTPSSEEDSVVKKPACVKALEQIKHNPPVPGNQKIDNGKEAVNKCEFGPKEETAVPVDKIRVLRESRSRSKQIQQDTISFHTSEKVHVDKEEKDDRRESLDENDSNSVCSVQSNSLEILQNVSKPDKVMHEHATSKDLCQSPRSRRSNGLATKTRLQAEISGENQTEIMHNRTVDTEKKFNKLLSEDRSLRSPVKQIHSGKKCIKSAVADLTSKKSIRITSQDGKLDKAQKQSCGMFHKGKKCEKHSSLGQEGKKQLERDSSSCVSTPTTPRRCLRRRDSQASKETPVLSSTEHDKRTILENTEETKTQKEHSTTSINKQEKDLAVHSYVRSDRSGTKYKTENTGKSIKVKNSETDDIDEKGKTAEGHEGSATNEDDIENVFYVNCMEMVKRRSMMRQEAQKSSRSTASPASSGSIPSKSNSVLRKKKITVYVSPVQVTLRDETKNASETNSINENVSDIRVRTPTTSSEFTDKKRKIDLKSGTPTNPASRLVQLSKGKSNEKMVQDIRKHGLRHSRSQTVTAEAENPASSLSNTTFNRRKIKVPRYSESLSSPGQRIIRLSKVSKRSPSPLFNRSPKFRKHLQNTRKTLSSSHNSIKPKSTVLKRQADVYDISNLSPLKPGENLSGSPKSGYSGETCRSRKRNRNWRQPQKHPSGIKSNKKLQKLKLPETEITRNIQRHKHDSGSKSFQRESFENRKSADMTQKEKILKSDGQPSKGRQIARHKLELDSPDLKCPQVRCRDGLTVADSHQPVDHDSKFIAIKKLDMSDLTILENEEEEQYTEKRSYGQGHNIKGSERSEKLVTKNYNDSGVGSSKEKSNRNVEENSSFVLKWQTSPVKSPKAKKVKLNQSWSLLSNRSVAKILDSEGDDQPFEGFQPEHTMGESLLGSEISYVETNEIELDENSEQEWLVDDNKVNIGDCDDEQHDKSDYIEYVNCTFTSPGKRTDSSWDETFNNYIDNQLNRSMPGAVLSNTSFHIGDVHSSPRRGMSPRRCSRTANGSTPSKRKAEDHLADSGHFIGQNHTTPKRRKLSKIKHQVDNGHSSTQVLEQVDDEIVFNYCSPQKLREISSPERLVGKKAVISSSPLKAEGCIVTSTPHTLRQSRRFMDKVTYCLPALDEHSSQCQNVSCKDMKDKTNSLSTCDETGTDKSCSRRSSRTKYQRHSVGSTNIRKKR